MSRFRFDGRGRGPSSQPGSSRFPWHWFKPTLLQPRSAKSGHCPAQYEASAPSALSPKFDAGTPCEDHPSFKRRAPRKGRTPKKRRELQEKEPQEKEGFMTCGGDINPPLAANPSTRASQYDRASQRDRTYPCHERATRSNTSTQERVQRHPGEGWSGIGRHLHARKGSELYIHPR